MRSKCASQKNFIKFIATKAFSQKLCPSVKSSFGKLDGTDIGLLHNNLVVRLIYEKVFSDITVLAETVRCGFGLDTCLLYTSDAADE